MEEKEYEFICLYVHKVLLKDTWKNYNIGCPQRRKPGAGAQRKTGDLCPLKFEEHEFKTYPHKYIKLQLNKCKI